VAKAIENMSFYQNARTAVKRLSTLYDVTTALGSVMKTDELFKEIVAIVRQKLGYRTVGILLLDESRQYLKVRAGIGYTSLDLKSLSIHVETDGVTGLAVKEDRPILVRDVREEPRYIGQRRPKSELAIPLRTKQGITGVLDVESEGAGSLTEDDVKLLTSLATFIAIAIDNAKLYEDIRLMADTDELTGAYNYRYLKTRLEEELTKAKKQKAKLSLLMLDLDNFKEINDSKGHSEGDHVLGTLAQKLKTGLRKDDVFTRYGGDEFMVILPQTDKQEAIKIAHRIKRIVEETRLRTSIGVATYPDDSDQLIETADKALYKAKEKGKDLVYSF
jgi:diguanylate cyclase (GGDEF)-like protein